MPHMGIEYRNKYNTGREQRMGQIGSIKKISRDAAEYQVNKTMEGANDGFGKSYLNSVKEKKRNAAFDKQQMDGEKQ